MPIKTLITSEMFMLLFLFLHVENINGRLWPGGIVHYAVDNKHYGVKSLTKISMSLKLLQKELCIKFVPAPNRIIPSKETPLLYIANPYHKVICSPQPFDFKKHIVILTIGKRCFSSIKRLTDNFVNMLKLSIPFNGSILKIQNENFYDDLNGSKIMTTFDRDYINTNYEWECTAGKSHVSPRTQHRENESLSNDNHIFYRHKLWPLGSVYYQVQHHLRYSKHFKILKRAIGLIEMDSCIRFYDLDTLVPLPGEVVKVDSSVFFGSGGSLVPMLGHKRGNNSILLSNMVRGAEQIAHTLNLLMRLLGIGMMSNRADRSDYISINWNLIDKGMERFLVKEPKAGWIQHIPYDYKSVTHAPYNFLCRKCKYGEGSIKPLQNDLWEGILGHSKRLSEADKEILQLLYEIQCEKRLQKKLNKF